MVRPASCQTASSMWRPGILAKLTAPDSDPPAQISHNMGDCAQNAQAADVKDRESRKYCNPCHRPLYSRSSSAPICTESVTQHPSARPATCRLRNHRYANGLPVHCDSTFTTTTAARGTACNHNTAPCHAAQLGSVNTDNRHVQTPGCRMTTVGMQASEAECPLRAPAAAAYNWCASRDGELHLHGRHYARCTVPNERRVRRRPQHARETLQGPRRRLVLRRRECEDRCEVTLPVMRTGQLRTTTSLTEPQAELVRHS